MMLARLDSKPGKSLPPTEHREEKRLSAFHKLPTEVIQEIAYFLLRDTDVINFALTCSFIAHKILPSDSSIWRYRFRDLYDTPKDRSSNELKIEYQIRSIVLSQKVDFSHGQHEKHTLWLEVLKDMLIECHSLRAKSKRLTSKTWSYVRKMLVGSEFLNRPTSGYADKEPASLSDLFCAVQLCLTELALDPSMSFRCRRADYDIGAVYSYGTEFDKLVELTGLNLKKILHIRNFWLRHMTEPDEGSFYDSFAKLPKLHKPKGSEDFLEISSELRTMWLGYYSCIHPHPESLTSLEERQTCADLDSHWTQVEPMSLQIRPHPDPSNWPLILDLIIPIQGPEQDRTYFRGFQKTHGITDDSTNLIRGFTESIASPQGGFEGWRRICFAIYDPNREELLLNSEEDGAAAVPEEDGHWFPEENWPPLTLETDFHWIHGYEGVLLPGGRMMIGRFVDMAETDARGPFIFWDC